MISIITPAHNEEAYLERCLASVKLAAETASVKSEHIVVINRCTDGTEALAAKAGCRIIHDDTQNLSHIRNSGVAAAKGEIIVTIDADSWMSPNMLSEVIRLLETQRYIGGGVRIYPERLTLGIICSLLIVTPFVLWHGVSAGMFWCYKRNFDAVGGFDESLACIEDIDFGKRLKVFGRTHGKIYGTIRKAHLTTSCRKFDQFGDWYFIQNPKIVFDIFKRNKDAADKFYYDARK